MDVESQKKAFSSLQSRINEAELAKDMAASSPSGPLQMTNQQVELAQEIGEFMKASRGGNEHVRLSCAVHESRVCFPEQRTRASLDAMHKIFMRSCARFAARALAFIAPLCCPSSAPLPKLE